MKVCKKQIVITVCAVTLLLVFAPKQSMGQAFTAPSGGWAYFYDGASGSAGDGFGALALDGTWDHANGSDEWDGTAPGTGNPGGVGVFTEGADTFLRIQDTGNPSQYGFTDPGSNRKIYFTHDVGLDGASDTFIDDGFTMSFRVRIPTTGALDDLYVNGGAGIGPWPTGGNGLVVSDRKSTFSVQQATGNNTSINFALAMPSDALEAGVLAEDIPTGGGLVMNNLNGTTVTNEINTGDAGTVNFLPLADPTAWNEMWIAVVPGGAGTHQVSIWTNGDTGTASVFDVTAGDNGEVGFPFQNVLAFGSSATPQDGAVDVDFLAFLPAAFTPDGRSLSTNADFDGSGGVDGTDLAIWESGFGTPSGALNSQGDFDFDEDIDGADFLGWQRKFDGGVVLTSPVPEPASLLLLVAGAVGLAALRRPGHPRC